MLNNAYLIFISQARTFSSGRFFHIKFLARAIDIGQIIKRHHRRFFHDDLAGLLQQRDPFFRVRCPLLFYNDLVQFRIAVIRALGRARFGSTDRRAYRRLSASRGRCSRTATCRR